MSDLTKAAHEVLARQHGAASIEDLAEVGMSARQVKDVIERGGLERVLAGAYRSPSVEADERQRMAAVCRAHPELVIAGPSAGRLYGLRRMPPGVRVDVIGPPHCHPTLAPWVNVFRTPTLRIEDVIERPDGIRILDRPRLAADLARWLNDGDLRSVVEQCMADGHHDVGEMMAAATDWATPRRRWARRYLAIVSRRLEGPAAESHLEVIVAERLQAAGVKGLRRQWPLRLADHGSIRFDLAIPEIRWALEIDGFPTHRELAGAHADAERDRAAESIGWTVRRIGPAHLADRLDATIARLAAEVHEFRLAAS